MDKKTKTKISAASLLVALGIIYGDIGTSPLYVLKAIVGERVIDNTLVYGGVSCVFWTLVLQTSVKYVWITLKADNEGEGGIFSLYALVRRYGKKMVIPTILGATTLLADGIITPPISVASAVEGLAMVEGLEHIPTVPLVILILTVIFFFQRFGTQKVGVVFGPVMVIWFGMLFTMGFTNLMMFPHVIKALHPEYAIRLLSEYPGGFWLLGAVFLATTGAEALYSDLGHCGKENIRITWVFVKICLVMNYLGQAAWVTQEAGPLLHGRNPFFEMMPDWFLIPGIVIATFAAIIASQALISGSYTLINEAMNLNFWPRVTVRQPTELKGQIYIPSVNTILWIGCILMILYFKSSTHMEAAYGFSITITMMMTTVLLSNFLYSRLHWNKILVWSVFLFFMAIETSFFVANVVKIKERWFFLFFELFIFLVMYIWYKARKVNNSLIHFEDLGKYTDLIKDLSKDIEIPKFATHLIYLTKANKLGQIEEKIIKSIFSKNPKRADVYWFVHINRTEHPYTLSYEVTELVDDKVIKVNINIGFRIQPKTEMYFKQIVKELVKNKELNLHIRPDGSSKYNPEPDFKFVIFNKFLSVENDLSIREGLLIDSYFFLRNLGLKDEKAFGLDRSDVVTELQPLLYTAPRKEVLTREK